MSPAAARPAAPTRGRAGGGAGPPRSPATSAGPTPGTGRPRRGGSGLSASSTRSPDRPKVSASTTRDRVVQEPQRERRLTIADGAETSHPVGRVDTYPGPRSTQGVDDDHPLLTVDFAGEIHPVAGNLTFGRRADIEIDDNDYLHRVVGEFVHDGAVYWLRNVGSRIVIDLTADDGHRASLPPGSSLALTPGHDRHRPFPGRADQLRDRVPVRGRAQPPPAGRPHDRRLDHPVRRGADRPGGRLPHHVRRAAADRLGPAAPDLRRGGPTVGGQPEDARQHAAAVEAGSSGRPTSPPTPRWNRCCGS